MTISVRSNIASIRAQTQLNRATTALSQNTERLSSGLRINRASDDAAALAVSQQVNADAKVADAAVRNLNDGLSYLSTAREAISQLRLLSKSMNELAVRASANTTKATRETLDDEFQALRTEFNRIVGATEYNYSDIFTSTNTQLVEQAGYGANGRITADLTGTYIDTVGTMSYGAGTTYTGGTDVSGMVLEDFNNDGYADIVTSSATNNKLYIQLGNGDGTFRARTSYGGAGMAGTAGVTSGDFDGDGQLDVVVLGSASAFVFLGNGDGTFEAATNNTTNSSTALYAAVGDFDEDGDVDVATAKSTSFEILFNTAGSLAASTSITNTLSSTTDVQTFDLNGDGHLDLISTTSFNEIYVSLGNGNGTFNVARSYTPYNAATLGRAAFGDLNGDGFLDVVTGTNDGVAMSVMLGNGDGSFKAYTSYASNSFDKAVLTDINGDGNLDMIATGVSGTSIITRVGNGDGTFKAASNQANGQTGAVNAVADLNGDHVVDLVYGQAGAGAYVSLSPTTTATYTKRVQTLSTMSIATQTGAYEADYVTEMKDVYLGVIDASISAGESRFTTAKSLNEQNAILLEDAYNKIVEVDVATEAEDLVRNQLVQQSASLVYQAANEQMTLAGSLIDGTA